MFARAEGIFLALWLRFLIGFLGWFLSVCSLGEQSPPSSIYGNLDDILALRHKNVSLIT